MRILISQFRPRGPICLIAPWSLQSSWVDRWRDAGVWSVAAQDTANLITIDNFTFTPPELTVAVGTTVKWVNHDDIPHLVGQ